MALAPYTSINDTRDINEGDAMLDELLNILPRMDLGTVLVTGAMLWQMYSRLDKKFDSVDRKFDAMGHRLDKMQETITDIDRRLCRLEGAFQSKECCLLKSDTQHKTAE